MPDHKADRLYADPLAQVSQFAFDQAVVEVFPDMIKRSVPGYATIINMIGDLAERYVQPASQCYDLGCSLGAATPAMRHRIRVPQVRIVAVDNSPAMIELFQQLLATKRLASNPVLEMEVEVELRCADIQSDRKSTR